MKHKSLRATSLWFKQSKAPWTAAALKDGKQVIVRPHRETKSKKGVAVAQGTESGEWKPLKVHCAGGLQRKKKKKEEERDTEERNHERKTTTTVQSASRECTVSSSLACGLAWICPISCTINLKVGLIGSQASEDLTLTQICEKKESALILRHPPPPSLALPAPRWKIASVCRLERAIK